MELEFSPQIFEKYPNIKFYENPSSVSRVVPFGRTGGRTDRRKDMTKLIIAFRSFANSPKKRDIASSWILVLKKITFILTADNTRSIQYKMYISQQIIVVTKVYDFVCIETTTQFVLKILWGESLIQLINRQNISQWNTSPVTGLSDYLLNNQLRKDGWL